VLLIAFVGLVASVALAVVYRGKISDSLRDALQEGLNKYDNDTDCQEAVNLMQSQVGLEPILVLIPDHIRSTVDRINAGLFL